jgi:hypothetical protein
MGSQSGGELESGLWAFEAMEHSSLDNPRLTMLTCSLAAIIAGMGLGSHSPSVLLAPAL